jgi:nucleolar protein 56
MHYLVTKWFGVFLCDSEGIKENLLFSKTAETLAEKLSTMDSQAILKEERSLVKGKKVQVREKRLRSLGAYDPEDPFFTSFTIEPDQFGFSTDLLSQATRILTASKVTSKLASPDLQLIQMVNTLDDLYQTANLLSERLECWQALPAKKEYLEPVTVLISTVEQQRRQVEYHIEQTMLKLAPNMTALIGPLLSARLIALAGGLERLSNFPASTIQLLGAEKALFRFKKEGGKPPKHGALFQHPLISKAPWKQRGKHARVLAGKIAIAARADFYTQRDIADELKQSLHNQLSHTRSL